MSELTAHEQEMIKVAEGGNPLDPSENAKEVINLPSEEAKEEATKEEPKVDEESPEEESKETEEETKDSEDSDEDGELTEEQKELVKLREEAKERAVYDAIGGKEEFVKLAQWAGDNLSEEQKEVYNQAVNQGNEAQAVFAAEALRAMREVNNIKTHGYQGDVTRPTGADQSSPSQGYESTAQMQVDMADTRYRSDPAFRAKVASKIAATKAGII